MSDVSSTARVTQELAPLRRPVDEEDVEAAVVDGDRHGMDPWPAVGAHRGEKGERGRAEEALARAGEIGRSRL